MNSPEDERISDACTLEDPQVIQALRRYREALETGQPLDRHEVFRRFPRIDEELRDCLDAIDVMHGVAASFRDEDCDASDSAALRAPPDSPRRVGDFRLIRMIGRGGMGVVYEAEQESLQRRVALKILPASVVLDPKNLRRFKIESQAAASLDHPNIVSIYSVGCENGVHYYAMQCVHGETLDQIIRRLREESHARQNKERPGRNGRPPIAEPEAGENLGSPRAATPHGAGMLEPTVHLADRDGLSPPVDRGPADFVRDDSAGPTCAWETPPGGPHAIQTAAGDGTAAAEEAPISFALPISVRDPEFFRAAARLAIQAADGLQHAHEMGVVHRDIKPGNLILDGRGCLRITDFGLARTAQSADTTLSGGVVGTPRYMSPEQLSGSRQVLDHRTDIYSLGVTLYELLTLKPAFDSDSRQHLMQQIAEKEPRPPCRVNRSIPRDLETIVLKSMAKDAASRYASAKDLADDLRRFLEHKPILARPASLGDRLLKWSRRHLWIIWTLIGLLVIGLVAASASSLIIWRARQEKEAARAQAQANLDDAVAAIDQMLSWVGQESLRNIPEMEQVRLGILHDALKYYRRFLLRNSDDAMIQEQAGRAAMRVAELYRLLGYQDSATASYQDAIDLLSELREDAPNGRVFPHSLGYAYAGVGAILHSTGNLSKATEAYQQAIDVFEGRPPDTHPWATSRSHVVEARIQMANVLADLGQFDQAERYYRIDIEYQRRRMKEGRLSLAETRAFGRGCIGLGNLLYHTGRCREAAESYRMAAELWRESAGAIRKGPDETEEEAWSLNNLGAALWSIGDLDMAEEALQRGSEISDKLTSRVLTADAYRGQHAIIKGNLALVKRGSRRDGEAEADNRLAIKILEELAGETPEVLWHRQHLCKFLNNLGALLAAQSRWTEAESALRQAIAVARLLALVYDDQPEISRDLARSLANLAVVLDSVDRHVEADKAWEEYAEIQSDRQARFAPLALGTRLPPANGQNQRATQLFSEAVVSSCPLRWSYWSGQEMEHIESSTYHDRITDSPTNRQLAWMVATRPHASHDDLVHAVEQAQYALSQNPKSPDNWTTRGMVEYRLGNYAAADDSLKKSVILDGRQALPMFLLALVQCRMGNLGQARTWYDMAEELQKKDPGSLSRLPGVRDEAASLLRALGHLPFTGKLLNTSQEADK